MIARRRIATFVALGVGALLAISWFSGIGRQIQIRLDTGELRFRFLGVTYRTFEQPQYVIARLRLATELPPRIKARWASCVPWRDMEEAESGGVYYMYYHQYARASAWCELSPRFGRLVLDDIVKWIEAGGYLTANPEIPPEVTTTVLRDSSHKYVLPPDWRESVFLKSYLERKGAAARDLIPAEDSEADST